MTYSVKLSIYKVGEKKKLFVFYVQHAGLLGRRSVIQSVQISRIQIEDEQMPPAVDWEAPRDRKHIYSICALMK